MKILLIHLVGGGGGIELYTSQVANSLSRQNSDVTLLIGSYIFNENYYKDSKVKIILIDSQKSYPKMLIKLLNPLTYHKLLGIINKEKPDVIHLTLEDLISGVLFCFLKLKGNKLVLTEHDPELHSGEKLLVKIHLSFTKYLFRHFADKIIVHGKKLKEILIQKGVPENKVKVIPHGEFSYYTRWSDKIQESKDTILFFGRIQEYKGLEYLIEAVPFIVSSIPNLKVIIAGEGDFDKYDKMIVDKKYFEIHNRYILDNEVAGFFQRANVVVLPYKDGTQSGVVPIAYSFKKPVIVTKVGSIEEVVDDGLTGLLIPAKNTNALANAVINILDNPLMAKKMGENGYNKIKSELSWDEIAKKTIETYREIL